MNPRRYVRGGRFSWQAALNALIGAGGLLLLITGLCIPRRLP